MKISDYYTYAPKSKIKAGDANPNGKYQFYTSSPDESRRCDEYLYDCKAIVMGTGGSATLHYYDGKFSTSTDCLTLIPNEKIRAKYLYYFFLANMDVLEAGFKGAGLKHTSKGYIDNIEITKIPSLPSQDKIVNLFDELALRIEKERRQIEKLDELVKARFVEMFGDRFLNTMNWPTKKLGDCATFRNGKAHEKVISETGQYVLITSRAIASDLQDVRHTDSLLTPLATGDIVMVMSDVPNGKALAKCLLITENEKYTLNQRICSLSNYDLNPVFFTYLLNRHQFFLSFNDGNGQTNLRKDDILNCPLIRPSIELQNQFANFVAQVDKSKFVLSNELTMCDFYIRLIHDRVMHGRINLRMAQ